MRERPQQPSREVLRGGVSRPATAEPVPLLASTGHRRCRWRRRSRPLRRSPSGRPQDRPHPQQPSREVQRGSLSRPAPAEPVPPPASTSRRHCRRRGRSRPQRRLHRDLTPAARCSPPRRSPRAHSPGPTDGIALAADPRWAPKKKRDRRRPRDGVSSDRDLRVTPKSAGTYTWNHLSAGTPGGHCGDPGKGFNPDFAASPCLA